MQQLGFGYPTRPKIYKPGSCNPGQDCCFDQISTAPQLFGNGWCRAHIFSGGIPGLVVSVQGGERVCVVYFYGRMLYDTGSGRIGRQIQMMLIAPLGFCLGL